MSSLQVRGLSKRFGAETVLRSVAFDLHPRRTLAILGRSGCGKTTLLKVLAGLEVADTGTIRLDGRDVTRQPAQQRGILYLSQDPLLFPHRDVAGNVGFGLELRGVAARERRTRVATMLEGLGLAEHARKRPHQLSGGQRQRVAFGRALAVDPPLLLLDEPFGALDADTRAAMQALFLDAAARFGITALLVTHDLKEAVKLGDRWGHLQDGRLRLFDDLGALVGDSEVGLAGELEFWRRLDREHN